MLVIPQNAALLLIDVQKGFDDPVWGKRNNPGAEANIAEILRLWRETHRPVVHIRHMSVEPESPLRPGQAGNEFKPEAKPVAGELIVEKTVNSAFIGTRLESTLRDSQIDTVVIVGISTDHCVSTTTRMAGNLGFNTIVVADATATFDRTTYDGRLLPADEVYAYALASLNQEFAQVIESKQLEQILAVA
jgi:nicotinamidase-related amidase